MGNCLKEKTTNIEQPQRSRQYQQPQTIQQPSKELQVIGKLQLYRDKLWLQKGALERNEDKAQNEARQLIKSGQKNRAMFVLKKVKLYQNILKDIDNQYVIVQKTITDVESKVQMAEFTKVLSDTNNLIKELESTIKLDELQQIGQDIKEREQDTREFNKLFEEHNVNTEEVDAMFAQFEAEVNQSQTPIKSQVVQKKAEIMNLSTGSKVIEERRQVQVHEEEGDEDINKQLAILA